MEGAAEKWLDLYGRCKLYLVQHDNNFSGLQGKAFKVVPMVVVVVQRIVVLDVRSLLSLLYDNMTQYYRETLFGEIVHGMLYEPDVNEYSHDSMVYMLT